MNRDEAIALSCGSLCLQLHSVLPAATEQVRVTREPITERDRTTWLVRGARLLTLIQTSEGTRVYDQADDFLYYASPNVELSAQCPDGQAFLAQAVVDRRGGELVPRLLVFDIVCPRIADPHERGAQLRGMAHLFPPACHVQWSGDRSALEAFLSRGMPHEVEGVVALRQPCCLVRDPPDGPVIAALSGLETLSRS